MASILRARMWFKSKKLQTQSANEIEDSSCSISPAGSTLSPPFSNSAFLSTSTSASMSMSGSGSGLSFGPCSSASESTVNSCSNTLSQQFTSSPSFNTTACISSPLASTFTSTSNTSSSSNNPMYLYDSKNTKMINLPKDTSASTNTTTSSTLITKALLTSTASTTKLKYSVLPSSNSSTSYQQQQQQNQYQQPSTDRYSTVFSNNSLPLLFKPPTPMFRTGENNSRQSLPTKFNQQYQKEIESGEGRGGVVLVVVEKQEEEEEDKEEQGKFSLHQQEYEKIRADELFAEMTLNHHRIPPHAPSAIKFTGHGVSSYYNNGPKINSTDTTSSTPRIHSRKYCSVPITSSGTANANVTATNIGCHVKLMAGNKIFKGLSSRFNSSSDSIPVVETVAQEYARTIKALWQMVEEEELAYQIDAATTARLAQQKQYQLRAQKKQLKQQENENIPKVRQNYTNFPMLQEYPSSLSLSSRLGLNASHASNPALKEDLETLALALTPGDIADSEDSDSDDEDDEQEREKTRHDLESLERDLATLGLQQRYKDSTDALDQNMSRRSSHHENAKPQVQQQQLKQQQRVLPSIQTTMQKPPYTRRRQNSLTYEERRLHQDVRKQFSKPSTPITPMSSPITPTRGATVNFFDGIVLDEESSDDNDDAVVLSVARRVSVRPHHQSDVATKHDAQTKGQQRTSWDKARGVSWSPLPKKLSPPTASLPEARLAITTMISAR